MAAAPAKDVYQGDHWRVVSELPTLATALGMRPELWIMSAGYGLIPAEAPIHGYSATFSARHPDTVVDADARTESAQAWWSAISELAGPAHGAPRRLADLVRAKGRTRMIIVASADYLVAALPDLKRAAALLGSSDNLLIVSARARYLDSTLAESVVPCGTRLQALVGGAAQSLNARVARKILTDAPRCALDAQSTRRRFLRLVRQLPAQPRYDEREPMTDDQVKDFIRKEVAALSKPPGWTPLLKQFRKDGQKCEQTRFRRLYEEVTGVKRGR